MIPSARARPRPIGAIIPLGVLLALLLAAGHGWTALGAIGQTAAIASLASANASRLQAWEALGPVRDQLDAEAASAEADADSARRVLNAGAQGFVGADANAGLGAAVATVDGLLAQVEDSRGAVTSIHLTEYSAVAIASAADQVDDEAAALGSSRLASTQLTLDLDTARSALHTSAAQAFESASALAPSIEAAHWASTVDEKLEFRRAAEAVGTSSLGEAGADVVQEYVDAGQAMAAAHEAELASFAGPLYENRVAALAFANSIAGGVLLEIDWVPELFGFGGARGMAGQATLESEGSAFFSSITLTDSVAERWGDGHAEAITAHEVGHAITLKCWDIFQASAGEDYEAFATAWAIGMGFTSDSNGTAAYGRPSDELIAASTACR